MCWLRTRQLRQMKSCRCAARLNRCVSGSNRWKKGRAVTAIRSVYQLLTGGTAGNAVVGEALAWQAALRGWGLRAQTFAAEVHPSLAGTVLPLARCKPTPADVLILHYTT